MLTAHTANELYKTCKEEHQKERLSNAEIEYKEDVDTIEREIEEACERGLTKIVISRRRLPKGDDLEVLGELLQAWYGYEVYMRYWEGYVTDLEISWANA